MVTQNTNPFVLPGFGQSGDMATNPMLASMEMMRKAWEGLASASGLDATQVVPGSSPEDLERRIADLRAVENWLRMNLSMLGSTIQALEVQRSTLATLQAFVASAGGGAASDTAPSPLDIALGIRRGAAVAPSADSTGLFGNKPADAPPPEAPKSPEPDVSPSSSAPSATEPAQAAIKSWWDMLQSQFDNLASATAAGLQSAEALQEAAAEAQKKAVESTRVVTEAMKESAETAAAPATKAAESKTAAKKATAKKSPAKKAASKNTAAKQPAAKKSSAKKSAARKGASKTASATRGASKS